MEGKVGFGCMKPPLSTPPTQHADLTVKPVEVPWGPMCLLSCSAEVPSKCLPVITHPAPTPELAFFFKDWNLALNKKMGQAALLVGFKIYDNAGGGFDEG